MFQFFPKKDSCYCPKNLCFLTDLPERKRTVLFATALNCPPENCNYYNSLGKIQRTFKYVYDFVILKFRYGKSRRSYDSWLQNAYESIDSSRADDTFCSRIQNFSAKQKYSSISNLQCSCAVCWLRKRNSCWRKTWKLNLGFWYPLSHHITKTPAAHWGTRHTFSLKALALAHYASLLKILECKAKTPCRYNLPILMAHRWAESY